MNENDLDKAVAILNKETVLSAIADKIKDWEINVWIPFISSHLGNQFRKLNNINIEPDQLNTISIIISNWERAYYIPYVIEMISIQDYPKNKIEIIIVDSNSENKDILYDLCKLSSDRHRDLNINLYQTNKDITKNYSHRRNVGARISNNHIILMFESDTIPLFDDYFKRLSGAFTRFGDIMWQPISIGCAHFLNTNGTILDSMINYFNIPHRPSHDFGIAILRNRYYDMTGFDEHHIGWGGHEGNFFSRLEKVGVPAYMDKQAYSLQLSNFPISMGNTDIKNKIGLVNIKNDWSPNYRSNNDWGNLEGVNKIELK